MTNNFQDKDRRVNFLLKTDGVDHPTEGVFHCWGVKTISCRKNGQLLTRTVGVVELDTGRIMTVVPESITFKKENI